MLKHRLLGLFAVGVIATFGLVIPSTAHAAAPLQVTTGSLPAAYSGAKYTTTNLKASGGTAFLGAYMWSIVAGKLPKGLTLSSGGQLSGTSTITILGDTSNPKGVYSFTVQVKDSKNVVATKELSVELKPLEIATSSLPKAKKGQLYYTQLKVNGSCTKPSWSADPAQPLPAGLKISTAGAISGAPKAVGVSTVLIKVKCGDGGGIPFLIPRAEKTFTLTVG